jgi:hypothetical protein
MMEAARTSETSVDIQLRTRQYIPEDSELHTRRRDNLKISRKMIVECFRRTKYLQPTAAFISQQAYSLYAWTTVCHSFTGLAGCRIFQVSPASIVNRTLGPQYAYYYIRQLLERRGSIR